MPRGRYTRSLKVCTPEGEKIYAIITPSLNTVHIEVRPLKAVAEDKPPFAQNGLIRFNVSREKYKESIINLTKYLESVLLKEMAKDESIYSSLGIKPTIRRNKKPLESRQVKKPIGERDFTSVHNSARRNEQTKSPGGRESDIDMAESSSEKISREDTGRD